MVLLQLLLLLLLEGREWRMRQEGRMRRGRWRPIVVEVCS